MTDKPELTLYPLGTAGWIPSHGQETICFCFFRGSEIFVIDAGTGIARLMGLRDTLFKRQWPQLKVAHIFISHYHYDHAIGLFWVRAIFRGMKVNVYAPGVPSYGKPALELLSEMFRKPFSPRPFEELIEGVEVRDLAHPGLIFGSGMDNFAVSIKLNPDHSDPTVSFRFGKWFAFVSDTPPENETVDFIRGVKVLLHEAYYNSSGAYEGEDDPLEKHRSGGHTGTFGAGLIAKRAGVERLYLVHHNPEIQMREIEGAAVNVARTLGIECRVAFDLDEIRIK